MAPSIRIGPTAARLGVLVSLTLGVGMLALYAMVISGHEATHALPAEEHAVIDENTGLFQEGVEDAAERLSFKQFMARVQAQEDEFVETTPSKMHLAELPLPKDLQDPPLDPADGNKLAVEVGALNKIADSAKKQAAEDAKWTKKFVPLNKKTVQDTVKLAKQAESEEGADVKNEKDAAIKKIQDIATSMSRSLDSMPPPPPGPPPAAPVTQSQAHTMVKDAADKYENSIDNVHQMLHPFPVKGAGSAMIGEGSAAGSADDSPASAPVAPAAGSAAAAPTAPAMPTAAGVASDQHMPPVVEHVPSPDGSMPPLPGGKSCEEVLKVGEATCRLDFWQAMDACTSETLAPKDSFKTPQCLTASAKATQQCEESLSPCTPEKAAAVAQQLRAEIMHNPADVAQEEATKSDPAGSGAGSEGGAAGSAATSLAATTVPAVVPSAGGKKFDEAKLADLFKEQMDETSEEDDEAPSKTELSVLKKLADHAKNKASKKLPEIDTDFLQQITTAKEVEALAREEEAVEPLTEDPKLSKRAQKELKMGSTDWSESLPQTLRSEHDDLRGLTQLVHEITHKEDEDEVDEDYDNYADALDFDIDPPFGDKEEMKRASGKLEIPDEVGDFLNQFGA